MRPKFVQADGSAYDQAPVLAELLGISELEALGMLLFLWRGALGHAHHSEKKPSGIVGGPARLKLVAAWCKWRADPQILVDALESLGFLEHLPGDCLRIRGTSRYWGTITRNSRPNARTRAKLKAGLEVASKQPKVARAGQGGPKAGHERAFISISNSMPLRSKGPPDPDPPPDPAVSFPADPDFLNPPPPAFPEKRFRSGSKPVVNVKGRKKASKAFDAIPPRAGEEEGKRAWDSKSWEELEGEISAGFFLGWWRASRLAPEREPTNFDEFWKRVEKAKCANRKILFAALKYQTQTTGAVAAPDRPLAVFILDSVWPQRIEEEPPPVPKCSFPGCTAKGRGSIIARWDKLLCYPHARLEDEKDVAADFATQEAICDVRH